MSFNSFYSRAYVLFLYLFCVWCCSAARLAWENPWDLKMPFICAALCSDKIVAMGKCATVTQLKPYSAHNNEKILLGSILSDCFWALGSFKEYHPNPLHFRDVVLCMQSEFYSKWGEILVLSIFLLNK